MFRLPVRLTYNQNISSQKRAPAIVVHLSKLHHIYK